MNEMMTIRRQKLGVLTEQRALRLCGVLILAAFPLYGGGQAMLTGGPVGVGLVLVLMNSCAVIVVGWLIWALIGAQAPVVARFYFAARLVEGLALGTGALIWVLSRAQNAASAAADPFYVVAMAVLALGSLPFCHWLLTSRRLSKLLGWGGIVGYSSLFAGIVAQQMEFATLAIALLVPGAVFELVFGVFLIAGRVQRR